MSKDSKEIYIERKTELELHNAISNFDIGAVTIIKLFQALDIPSSKYTQEACRLEDQHRVDIVQLTSKSSTRRRCQVIRALKKEKDDQLYLHHFCEVQSKESALLLHWVEFMVPSITLNIELSKKFSFPYEADNLCGRSVVAEQPNFGTSENSRWMIELSG